MQSINRRAASAAVVAALLPIGRQVHAQPQAFPSRTISVVVGFPPGGATDVTARVIQPTLQKAWGQAVIVENVPGAGGSIGVQKMLGLPADGHVLFLGTASDTVLTPLAIQTARYKAESLRLVGYLGQTDFIVAARPGLTFASLDEMVEESRKGKELSYASFGHGSIYHLIGEDLRARSGMKLLHVPFQGMGPTITNLIGNQIDLAFLPIAGQTVGLVNAGRVRALAVTGARRNAQLPSVPVVDETRAAHGLHHTVWLGMFAPLDLPGEAAAKVNSAVNSAIQTAEYRTYAAENGMRLPDPAFGLEACARFYAAEAVRMRQLAAAVKLEPR